MNIRGPLGDPAVGPDRGIRAFVWDIGNAIRRSTNEPATGLDNVITMPRRWRAADQRVSIELGVLGPMIVGSLAGILLVLLAGRSAPTASETAGLLEQVTGRL